MPDPSAPSATPAAQEAAVSILLVDDDPRNLLVLESILQIPEHRLVKAQTAEAALHAVMHGEFAAIVLDVQLPDLSGIELARMLKQRRTTQHIPILFLTAHYRESEHAVLGYDAGAVDYLTKPVHPGVLRSKVSVFVELFRKTRALAAINRSMEAEISARRDAEFALRTANEELGAKNIALERQAEERNRRIRAEAAQAEAEAANAAKDRFLAMLSHELRTPLSPVLHALTLLEEGDIPPTELRENLQIIRRNVQLEARLIDDLLDLARVRNGKLQLNLQLTDAHEVLKHALEICAPDIGRQRLNVETHLDAGRHILNVDPARLQQIFWNLISNAVKFTPPGGTITVSTSDDADKMLRAQVKDSGIGISGAQLPRIFDAFEQATPGSSPGLGLGLAICKVLTEFHHGTISASSAGLGHGTEFTVSFPLAEQSAVVLLPEKPQGPDFPSARLRLLVVEDHPDSAATLRRLLLRRGYDVRCVDSVSAALQAAEAFQFDVLLSDINLPDGTGINLFRTLRETYGDRTFRGVALSGFGMDEDVARSIGAGFSAHLTKPVDFPLLQRCLAGIGEELLT